MLLAVAASISAWAQEAVGNSKINVDFSKYKTFSWAQSDATVAGPGGYDIYYYEFEADDQKDPNQKKEKTGKNRDVSQQPSSQQPTAYVYSYSVIIPAKDVNADEVIRKAIAYELEGRGYRQNPGGGDLIVAYQVLDKKGVLHGFNNDDPMVASGEEVRQESDAKDFAVEPGSLIVNLVDAKTSEVVWTGFTTDMMDNDAFVTEEGELKESIHSIFDKFKYTADKASKD